MWPRFSVRTLKGLRSGHVGPVQGSDLLKMNLSQIMLGLNSPMQLSYSSPDSTVAVLGVFLQQMDIVRINEPLMYKIYP